MTCAAIARKPSGLRHKLAGSRFCKIEMLHDLAANGRFLIGGERAARLSDFEHEDSCGFTRIIDHVETRFASPALKAHLTG